MKRDIRPAIARLFCVMTGFVTGVMMLPAAWAAEPLNPMSSPSLYEQQGTVSSIDTATGAMSIGGKRYKGNANTVIFIADGDGRVRKGTTLADIPAHSPVSFSSSSDGTVTQILIGNGIRPAAR